MAHKDASVAVENAIQKLEEHPRLTHQYQKLTTIKRNLQRFGSEVGSLVHTHDAAAGGVVHEMNDDQISQLSHLRGIAYDTEDVINSLESENAAAKRRWRKLHSVLSFVGSREQQLDDIEKRMETVSIQAAGATVNPSAVVDASQRRRCTAATDIPEELKPFYFSLSGFLEGTEISVRSLIQVWIAEGGSTMEEEDGHDIIEELLTIGVISGQKGIRGSLKTFTIDDNQLRLCRVAAEKEEFIKVIEYCGSITPDSNYTTEQRKQPCMRLAIHHLHEDGAMIERAFKNCYHDDYSSVRSLQIHTRYPLEPDSASSRSPVLLSISNFSKVRVLDLGFTFLQLESVPEEIGKKMIHLRYLRLKAPNVSRIPSSIWKLAELQTLDMKETRMVKTLPGDIWGTKRGSNLRHLHLGGSATLLPPRRAQHYNSLDNLRTLSAVCPDMNLKRLMVRAKLLNLRRLKLQIKSPIHSNAGSRSWRSTHHNITNTLPPNAEAIAFLNSLDHLYHLQSLTVSGPIGGFPSDPNAFPLSLTKMTLSGTKIPVKDCMATLEKMPNLRFLKMLRESVIGSKINIGIGGYPALQSLRLEELGDFESWTLQKGAMRCVRCLIMTRCGKLEPPKELKDKENCRVEVMGAANGSAVPMLGLPAESQQQVEQPRL